MGDKGRGTRDENAPLILTPRRRSAWAGARNPRRSDDGLDPFGLTRRVARSRKSALSSLAWGPRAAALRDGR